MTYTVNLEINGQPNVKKLTVKDINKLTRLFDNLEDQTETISQKFSAKNNYKGIKEFINNK